MNKAMEKPGVGVAIIVRKDNKVLFGKRLKKFGKNTWHPPGGHIEIFESIERVSSQNGFESRNEY